MSSCDGGGPKKIALPSDPREVIQIEGGTSIRVDKQEFDAKTIYTINYVPLELPEIVVTAPAVVRVGTFITNPAYTLDVLTGSNPIASKTIEPADVDISTVPVSWNGTSTRSTSVGTYIGNEEMPYKVTVIDSEGNKVEKLIGVTYKYPFYTLLTVKDSITKDDIIGQFMDMRLGDSIHGTFKEEEYTGAGVPQYLYWIFPKSTPGITSAYESVIVVPITNMPPITLDFNGTSVEYQVVRTVNKSTFNKSIITIQP